MKSLLHTGCALGLFLTTQLSSQVVGADPALPDPAYIALDASLFDAVVQDAIENAEEAAEVVADPGELLVDPSPWAYTDEHHRRRSMADQHAPAGLTGDHVLEQGEWTAEYRYIIGHLEDNRAGSSSIGDLASTPYTHDGIATNFGASPIRMTRELHSLQLMHGVSDDLTLYTILNFPVLTMDHIRGPGNPTGGGPGSGFTSHTSGIGDTVFGVLGNFVDSDADDLIVDLGFSVPTGDILDTSSSSTGGLLTLPLPYPMRKGSGTFNARPAVTWKQYAGCSSYGAQLAADLPIGENYRDYAVSDVFKVNVWYSHLITENLALSLRIENLFKTNYDGADPETPDGFASTYVETFRGGYFLNVGVGVAAIFSGHLVNFEFIPTAYQHLEGVQLETDWSIVASWSRSF